MKEQLLHHAIIAIIRGVQPANVPLIIDALYKGGIRAAEITLNSEGALPLIRQLVESHGSKMLIGAGTVLSASAAIEAIAAGAQFIISPSLDPETISVTKANGILSIPGAYTATEIVNAYTAGADIVKVFPATSPQYVKDLRGPLNHIPLMPTGGVTLQNIAAFKAAGGVAVGIGSALVDSKEEVTTAYLNQLSLTARAFVKAIQ